jgi:hypothetical protein
MKTYLFIWRISGWQIPRALLHMALDRRSLRKNPDITFYKSLGTGEGKTFTPNDADSRTWAIVISTSRPIENFDSIKPFSTWRQFAMSEDFFELETISSHGLWAGTSPFLATASGDWKGEVATITRARIAWRENLHFWRAVPPVTQTLLSHEGLISAIGIGEAPIGLQGTFSHWRSQEALRAFAYQSESHKRAIAATAERRWYKEELFARFAVKNHSFVTLKR